MLDDLYPEENKTPNFMAPSFKEPELYNSHISGLSVYEEGDTYVIEASLPGVTQSNINVCEAQGYLIIEGKRDEACENKNFIKTGTTDFSYKLLIPSYIDLKKEPERVFFDGIIKIAFEKK